MPQMSKRVTGIVGSGKTGWEVHFAAAERRARGEDILMCSIGDHDFPTPEESVEACVAAVRAGHHHYTDIPGLAALRDRMAELSARSTGVPAGRRNVIATVGGQGALFAAMQACLDPGDHAIIVAPYYATYPGTVRAAGGALGVVETRASDDFQPTRAELEAAAKPNTRVLLINSPNNPTGAVYARKTLEAIAAFCRERDLWLVSDEVYWTFADGDVPHISPLSLPGMEERTLVVNSVSKSHGMTGWRVGWLRAPEPVIDRLTDLGIVVTYGLTDFVSHAVAEAMANDWGVEEISQRYRRRRAILRDAFAGLNEVTVRGSTGGMYVMLDVRAVEPSGERFAWDLLAGENMAVMPGESFGEAAAGHIRISLCQPEDVLREAATRLKRFVAGRRPRQADARKGRAMA
jgi:arginine:pyruvate transaminase